MSRCPIWPVLTVVPLILVGESGLTLAMLGEFLRVSGDVPEEVG